MQARADAAFYTEATERDQGIRLGRRLAVDDDAATGVDVGELCLQGVETVRGAHTEADVALEVPGMVLRGFLARAVLREVLGSVHNKLELVRRVGEGLRIDSSVEETIRRREENE